MPRARRLAGVFALIATAYVALPYVTLYRLGTAIRDGDAASLEALVDWDGVREGLKEDICDAMAEQPDAQQVAAGASEELPAFGSGFMRGIAVGMIDQAVSAGALVTATRVPPSSLKVVQTAVPADPQPRITWAFFDGPTSFGVELLPPGADAPIRLQLSLRRGEWQVTRAWLPPEMLTPQADRT